MRTWGPLGLGLLVSTLALSGPSALAADPLEAPVDARPDQGEYSRLTQELESLAERNAWSGAARTYEKLVATGVPPSYQDLLYGAHAAQAVGNIGAVRARLLRAKEIREDKDVIESLWALDEAFASVDLQCDPQMGWVLSSATRPFEPDQVRAIEFAIEQIATTCHFDGYLPAGTYEFCGRPFDVRPGVSTVGMDMRGLPVPKKQKKQAKKDKEAAE